MGRVMVGSGRVAKRKKKRTWVYSNCCFARSWSPPPTPLPLHTPYFPIPTAYPPTDAGTHSSHPSILGNAVLKLFLLFILFIYFFVSGLVVSYADPQTLGPGFDPWPKYPPSTPSHVFLPPGDTWGTHRKRLPVSWGSCRRCTLRLCTAYSWWSQNIDKGLRETLWNLVKKRKANRNWKKMNRC